MTSIGIIRRIDELGRIIIPKDIRRVLKIKDGDPLEISVNKGAICLKKCKPDVAETWHEACAAYLERMDDRHPLCDVKYIHQKNMTMCVAYTNHIRKVTGRAYLNTDEDKNDPIIGQAIAYCRALNGQDCDYMRLIGLEG